MSHPTCLPCLTQFCCLRGITKFLFQQRLFPVPPGTQCSICSTTCRRRVFFALPCTLPEFHLQYPHYFVYRRLPRTPSPQRRPRSPPALPQRQRLQSTPGTPPIMRGVGLGGGFSPLTVAPAGEKRRKTYELEEDCPTCYEQDNAGHRLCLRCNASCCNACWFKMDTCPICRYSKN